MQNYSLTHVSDTVLLRDLASLVARDRMTTAMLLAHVAEVDHRRLYLPAGYASMHAYCLDELRLSEDAAFRRIRAARAARQFPALFEAVAEGRLHLAGVSLLAPHLTVENADELIESSVHKRKIEIEELLARRFGAPPPPSIVRPVRAAPLVPGRVDGAPELALGRTEADASQLVPGRVGGQAGARGLVPGRIAGQAEASELVPGRVAGQAEASELVPGRVAGQAEASELVPGRVDPPSRERFLVQVTVGRSAYDKLRRAQELLSHAVPSGDVAQVLERALDVLIAQLERRRLGVAASSRRSRTSDRKRHVPAQVRRAVWERDRGQCTFVSATGRQCQARRLLQFDHIEPVARGGSARVENIRLRCRAHNQLEAERAFGAEHMARKRGESEAQAQTRANAKAQAQTRANAKAQVQARANAKAQVSEQDARTAQPAGAWPSG